MSDVTATTEGSDNIAELLTKRAERENVAQQILDLVDRAEEKHRNDRQNRRKWNRILIRLEDSLVEAKRAVAECDTLIQIEKQRDEETPQKPAQPPASAPAEPQPAITEPDPEKRAAYKIANVPIEELASVSLQEVAFARAYTARRAFGTHDKKFTKRLFAKLELASQLPGVRGALQSEGERRRQNVLREAIVKVQQGQINSMNDEEIELVVGCYKTLSGKLIADAENTRLLEIMSGMIEALKAERSRRHLSSR
jgi:hypothetical protein